LEVFSVGDKNKNYEMYIAYVLKCLLLLACFYIVDITGYVQDEYQSYLLGRDSIYDPVTDRVGDQLVWVHVKLAGGGGGPLPKITSLHLRMLLV
jgi:hypothetical protein